ncbi:Inosose dehydratase [compost metagenome]
MGITLFYNHIVQASKQRHIPIHDVMKQVAQWGVTGVELDHDEIGADPQHMKLGLDQAGLTVSLMYGFFDFVNDTNIQDGYDFIDRAVYMGAPKVLIIPGFAKVGDTNETREIAKHRMAQALTQLVDYAAQHKITVTMEDFDDELATYRSSEELLWFMTKVPGLACTFDTGNFLYCGEDVLDAFDCVKDYIVHVHCKDRSLQEQQGVSPKITMKGTALYPSPVGEGVIPIEAIIEKLQGIGYQGNFAIEHFDADDHWEYIHRSVRFLQSKIN